MKTKVIIGVEPEGSEQPALRWGVSYAAASGAHLVAATAWQPDQAEVPPDVYDEMESKVRDHVERELAEAEAADGVEVPYDVVVRSGSVDDVLAAVAADVDAELIVVGHPKGSAARWTSSVLHLASHGDLPVVIAQGDRPALADRPIVTAIDGARADVAVLAWAAQLAASAGSELRPAIAVPAGIESYPHPTGATTAEHQVANVEEEVASVARTDDRIPAGLSLTVLEGEPADQLGALARELDATMVVCGQGRGRRLDKIPAELIAGGGVDVAVVPAALPDAWHEAHGDRSLPGEHRHEDRWSSLLGWIEESLGWAVADRRAEAHGELRRLAAADPGTHRDLSRAEEEELLDEAEERVRRDHGDLAPGVDPDDAPRRTPPEAG